MRAMVINDFGDSNLFTEATIPKPQIMPGHVIIRVKATSVNPLDCKIRSGLYSYFIPSFPAVLHGDVAGVIDQVGEGVQGFAVGDEVYGCAGGFLHLGGALAEYMLADADLIAHKPKTLSLLAAAALPLVALTAWEGIVTYANLQPEQSILIHGGTGGVGHVAVQLAKWLGGKVYTTISSSAKMDIVKKLGADVAIDYKKNNIESYVKEYTNGAGFAVVFDTLGDKVLEDSFEAAALYGKVVSTRATGQHDLTGAFKKGLTVGMISQPLPLITGINRKHYGRILAKIADLVDAGAIKPLIDENKFTMQQVGAAHARLESGRALGKIVIAID